jgi:hypothetical protein
MNVQNSKFYRWLFSTPYRALHRAYEASKKVRNIQRDYLFYKNAVGDSSKRSFYNVTLYIDSILNQSASTIFWSLLEFQISINLCNFFAQYQFHFSSKSLNNPPLDSLNTRNWQNTYGPLLSIDKQNRKPLNSYTRSFKQKFSNFFNNVTGWKNRNLVNYSTENFSLDAPSAIEKNCFFLKKFYNKNLDWERWNRKLTWIEAVLIDLETLKNTGWFSSDSISIQNNQRQDPVFNFASNTSLRSYRNLKWDRWSLGRKMWGQKARSEANLNQTARASYRSQKSTEKSKDTAYESLGLVPRSITRTLSRFQTELAGRSASLVLPEFRLAKYQAITSLKYLAFLIFFPWVVLTLCKILFLEPLIENWWNTAQFQIFLSFSQEEKALKRLQQVEELLWLDIIMADSSAKQPQDLSAQIHQRTIDLVETYNQESIQTILHFFTNFIFLFVVISLLIWGKKRLAILNSWVQEVFYSLSDTMKAFFILLFTDLCIGFHSPHGWEILIGFILENLGFSHDKHVISCFVSTFPVILDTVFKYWIFRHLNRISPSIVVSYHTMNE